MRQATTIVSIPTSLTLACGILTWPTLAGDFNDDGFEDIAIGVPRESLGPFYDAGCVNVIYGSPLGLVADAGAGAVIPGQLWHQNTPGVLEVREIGDLFGYALAEGDFNADGFDDLAIGAPGEKGGKGKVHVIYGSPAGLTATGNVLLDQKFLGERNESGDAFGRSIAAGDFNGDGVDDLAIGVPFEDLPGGLIDCGVVHVAFGMPGGGFTPGPMLWQGMGLPDPPEPGDYFGWSLEVGDFDLDGFDDLVIGVPGEDKPGGGAPDAGMVHVFPGSPSGPIVAGPAIMLTQDLLPGLLEASEHGDEFGRALAVGDVNGDGVDDLAIGAPGETLAVGAEGTIAVILGAPGFGLLPPTAFTIIQETFSTETSEPDDEFGSALHADDLNGDGFDDLIAGVPLEKVGPREDAGIIIVMPGGPAGPGSGGPTSIWHQSTPGIAEATDIADHFGFAFGSGDYNGDGLPDLAIGVPREDIGATVNGIDCGCVNVLNGSPTWLTAAGNQLWHQNRIGVPEAIDQNDWFGFAIAR